VTIPEIWETWIIHTCVTFFFWHVVCVCVTWLIHVWRGVFIRWHIILDNGIHMCDMTHFICVTWPIHMCDTTHVYSHFYKVTIPDAIHDSFNYVPWLRHVCDMTHSCVTSLIHICDMTHSYSHSNVEPIYKIQRSRHRQYREYCVLSGIATLCDSTATLSLAVSISIRGFPCIVIPLEMEIETARDSVAVLSHRVAIPDITRYERVMAHIWMSHGTYVKGTCNVVLWVMVHIWMSCRM